MPFFTGRAKKVRQRPLYGLGFQYGEPPRQDVLKVHDFGAGGTMAGDPGNATSLAVFPGKSTRGEPLDLHDEDKAEYFLDQKANSASTLPSSK